MPYTLSAAACRLVLPLAWLAVLSGPLSAQDEPGLSDILVQRISMDFRGGTVGDFVKKASEGIALNVVVRSDVNERSIPPVILRDIPVDAVLRSLNDLSLGEVMVRSDDTNSYMVVERAQGPREFELQVLNVSLFLLEPAEDGTPTVSGVKQEQLLGAIEMGLQMLGESAEKPQIQLHPQTCLLFVKGGIQEVELVRQIVAQLRPGADVGSGFGEGRGGGGGGFSPGFPESSAPPVKGGGR